MVQDRRKQYQSKKEYYVKFDKIQDITYEQIQEIKKAFSNRNYLDSKIIMVEDEKIEFIPLK